MSKAIGRKAFGKSAKFKLEIGSPIGSGTPGSVLFIDASTQIGQDNSNFFWDDANNRLGIGTATPSVKLEVGSSVNEPLALFHSTVNALNNGTNIVEIRADDIIVPSSYNLLALSLNGTDKLNFTGEGSLLVGDVINASSIHQIDVASIRGGVSNSGIRVLFPLGGGLTNTEFGALAHRDGVWHAIYGKQGSASTALFTDGEVNMMNGNVGIGTITPGAKLDINGDSDEIQLLVKGNATQTNDIFQVQDSAGAGDYFNVFGDGKIGIGTDVPLENQDNPVAKYSIKGDGTTNATASFIIRNSISGVNNSTLMYVRDDFAVGFGSLSAAALKSNTLTTNYDILAGTTKRFGFFNVSGAVGMTGASNNIVISGNAVTLRGGFNKNALFIDTTRRVIIGIGTTTTSRFMVDGLDDIVQCRIQGFTSQTNDIFVVEKSDGTDYAKVDGSGQFHTKQGVLRNTTRVTTTPYTILSADHHIMVNTDGAARTVNLPAGVAGTEYRIINTGTSANDVIINPNGVENLLGANSSFTLKDGESLIIVYEPTDGWY